ncbi:MAG: hypothetical protein JST_000488 [Candidatus Parcubacteria bacterium]|nr:MAG: hypothetical protein JST_4550 [Candidatus Parcubacteria bacterium]
MMGTIIVIILAVVAAFVLFPLSVLRLFSGVIVYAQDRILLNLDPKTGDSSVWIDRLEKNGYGLSSTARDIFIAARNEESSSELMGITILKNKKGRLAEIREEAKARGLLSATVEVAALLRERISDHDLRDMKLDRLIIMHSAYVDRYGVRHLLCIRRDVHSFAYKTIGTFIEKEEVSIFSKRTGYVFLSPEAEKRCFSFGDYLLKTT